MENLPKSGKKFKLRSFIPKEREEQTALCKYLHSRQIPFFAIPNGEKRDVVTATNLKRQGVKAGVPDIMVPVPTTFHAGLFLELKRRDGGAISKAQREWVDLLNKNGYLALFVYGWEDASKAVEKYLAGEI